MMPHAKYPSLHRSQQAVATRLARRTPLQIVGRCMPLWSFEDDEPQMDTERRPAPPRLLAHPRSPLSSTLGMHANEP